MAILLTRSRRQAERTAEKLRALGHEVIYSPVLEIVPLEPDWPEGPFDAVLATSAHALMMPLPLFLTRLPLLVVGDQTARAAQYHHGPIFSAGGNWHDLLKLAHEHPFRHFIYLVGHDRKPDFERDLAEFAKIAVVETYEARAASALTDEAVAALRGGRIDTVLHYSRRSCEIFLALLQMADLAFLLPDLRHLCFSADVAEPLKMLGLTAELAEKPDEAHLFAALSR